MQIIRDNEMKTINILDNNKVALSIHNIPGFLICDFLSYGKLFIRKEDDESLYNNLEWLMRQSYTFSHELSMKDENRLVWFSENCYDINNEHEVDNTPRMVIEREDEGFSICCKRPFFEKHNIKSESLVHFCSYGNRYECKNESTDTSLQDDMIYVFNSTLTDQKIEKDYILTK